MLERLSKFLVRKRKGFALLLVLGIMTLMSILVAGLSMTCHSEIQVSASFTDRIRCRYLAYSGIQVALYALAKDSIGVDSYNEAWSNLKSLDEGLELGDGYFVVKVTDESGKININKTDILTLETFFYQLTNDDLTAEGLTDSVFDWRDPDDIPRPLGAESDYYSLLPQPYLAKNKALSSPYELLLIKGMTKEIFYGNPNLKTPPLTELVTTLSISPNVDERGLPRIDIQRAPRQKLQEALGDILTDAEIDAILRFREESDITSPLDLLEILTKQQVIDVWERIKPEINPIRIPIPPDIVRVAGNYFDGLVNLNTAPPEVISALLPNNQGAFEEIIQYRQQSGGFQTVGELLNIASLTEDELEELAEQVCTKSSVFRLKAVGVVGNNRSMHLIDCAVIRLLVREGEEQEAEQEEGETPQQSKLSVRFIVWYWRER